MKLSSYSSLIYHSYQTGLRTQIIMVSVGMAFAVLQVAIYTVHNRRVAEGKHKPRDGEALRIYVT